MSSLTNTSIAKLPIPSERRALVFDSHKDAPGGFGIKLTATGAKIFIFRYSFDGRQRLKTIGPFPSWKVEAARLEAQRLRVEIDNGRDPLETKRQRRLNPLVADVVKEWLDRHAARLKSGPEIKRSLTTNLLPHIGKLKVSDVSRSDLIHALENLFFTSPRAAERTLGYIKQVFRFALDREYTSTDPAAGLRKTAFGQSNRTAVGRDRILDTQEIRSFWNANPASIDVLTHLCLKLVLVTGQRPGECAGMAFSEIHGDVWTIPGQRRKTAQSHVIHLTPLALAIISEAKEEVARRQRRRGGDGAKFIFESRPGKGISTATLSQAVIRNAVDFGVKAPAWTPHDLRRTCRTKLSAIGVAPHIAEEVIGHQRRGVIAIYDRHGYSSEIKAALQKWDACLLEILNNNVVAFPIKTTI